MTHLQPFEATVPYVPCPNLNGRSTFGGPVLHTFPKILDASVWPHSSGKFSLLNTRTRWTQTGFFFFPPCSDFCLFALCLRSRLPVIPNTWEPSFCPLALDICSEHMLHATYALVNLLLASVSCHYTILDAEIRISSTPQPSENINELRIRIISKKN